MKKGHRATQSSNEIYDITEHDLCKFCCLENADFWDLTDRLSSERDTLTKTHFKLFERACGLKYNADSVIADEALRAHFKPADALRYDPMHVILSGGIAVTELWCWLCKCSQELGVRFSTLRKFVDADWAFPAHRKSKDARKLKSFFSDKREETCKRKGDLKCCAGEILAVYAVIRHFARMIVFPTGRMQSECLSLFALCDVIDAYLVAKLVNAVITPVEFARRVETYFRLHKLAWGIAEIVPKMHWLLHISVQFLMDGHVYDCFVNERLHHLMKRHTEVLYNTFAFEKTLLMRTFRSRFRMLQTMETDARVQPSVRSARMEKLFNGPIYLGKHMTHASGHYGCNDIVMTYTSEHMRCFQIQSCFVGGCIGFEVLELGFLRKLDEAASEWCFKSAVAKIVTLASLGVVRQCHCWTYRAGGVVVVLHHSCH